MQEQAGAFQSLCYMAQNSGTVSFIWT